VADPSVPAPDPVAMAKALSHPLRFRLLQHYSQDVASPSALARTLGARLGDVTYHTRVLRDLGCVELVRTARRRGAREHFYRATVRPMLDDADASALPEAARRSILAGVVSDIWADLRASADAGALDRPDVHVSRTVLRLDDEGWAELSARLAGLLDHALRIGAESEARLDSDSSRAEIPAELALLHFARGAGPGV
jgi:DNA-binding transcriptional ArsR family regulator